MNSSEVHGKTKWLYFNVRWYPSRFKDQGSFLSFQIFEERGKITLTNGSRILTTIILSLLSLPLFCRMLRIPHQCIMTPSLIYQTLTRLKISCFTPYLKRTSVLFLATILRGDRTEATKMPMIFQTALGRVW